MERIAKVLTVALVALVLLGAAGLASGCGDSEEEQARADLGASLTDMETALAGLRAQGTALTVGDLKRAQPFADAFEKVLQAAAKVPGVNATAFETGFKALRAAVFAYPDETPITTVMMDLLPMAMRVLADGQALKAFVSP